MRVCSNLYNIVVPIVTRYDVTLREYLDVVSPSTEERVCILAQLCEAVDHLVRHNVAHRDIKADNVLLDTSKGQN